jgi:hypothetical protein
MEVGLGVIFTSANEASMLISRHAAHAMVLFLMM